MLFSAKFTLFGYFFNKENMSEFIFVNWLRSAAEDSVAAVIKVILAGFTACI